MNAGRATIKAKEAYEALDAMMLLTAESDRDEEREFLGEETLVDAVQRVRDAYAADPEQAQKVVDRWLREQAAGVRESDPAKTRPAERPCIGLRHKVHGPHNYDAWCYGVRTIQNCPGNLEGTSS